MKLVQMTSQLARRFGDEKAIRMIKDAGFDGFDFTMDASDKIIYADGNGYIDYVKNLKKISKSRHREQIKGLLISYGEIGSRTAANLYEILTIFFTAIFTLLL